MFQKLIAFCWRFRRPFCEAVAIAAACFVAYAMLTKLEGARGLMTKEGQPMFGDFLAFWSAGTLALQGKVAMVHDPVFIHHFQTQLIPGLPVVSTYNSPPTFTLLAQLLGLMPYPVAAIVFLVMSWIVYFIAARKLLPDWRSMLFAATCPAAVYEIGSIQTGLLIAGVTGLALAWQDRRPLVAGSMIALLAIKPHLAILWPVYLLVTGRWRMFIAAAISTGAFIAAAALTFGIDSYTRFLTNLDYTQKLISEKHVSVATFGSLYGNLIAANVPHPIPMIAQGISAACAVLVALVVWRKGDVASQAAAFCAATMLASPYLFFYDSTLLALGAAFLGAPRNKLEFLAFAASWAAGLSVAIGFIFPLPVVPLCSWLLLIAAARRGAFSWLRIGAPRLAPAPQM